IARLAEDFVGESTRVSVYGKAKLRAEKTAIAAGTAAGLDVVIARGFAFVGPHLPLDAHFAIGNFIRDALSGGPIQVRGDGTPVRSYLYAADMTIWLLRILFRGTAGTAYNVGSEEAIRVADLARLVAEELGPGLEVEIAQPAQGSPPDRYVPST